MVIAKEPTVSKDHMSAKPHDCQTPMTAKPHDR
jgi:hypothetical protein